MLAMSVTSGSYLEFPPVGFSFRWYHRLLGDSDWINVFPVRQFLERYVFFADPKPGEADGYLLTADRAPNGRGAAALGFSPKLPDPEAPPGSTDLLIVFGLHILEHFPAETAAAWFKEAGKTYLFAAHAGGLEQAADVVLPTALPAEKTGSYTNVGGMTQSFECAVPAPRGSLPEGEILARLAAELGVKSG